MRMEKGGLKQRERLASKDGVGGGARRMANARLMANGAKRKKRKKSKEKKGREKKTKR